MLLEHTAGGFSAFPTLGLKALKNTWNFDFQQVYIGAGMICPLIVDWSIMLGAIACYVSSYYLAIGLDLSCTVLANFLVA